MPESWQIRVLSALPPQPTKDSPAYAAAFYIRCFMDRLFTGLLMRTYSLLAVVKRRAFILLFAVTPTINDPLAGITGVRAITTDRADYPAACTNTAGAAVPCPVNAQCKATAANHCWGGLHLPVSCCIEVIKSMNVVTSFSLDHVLQPSKMLTKHFLLQIIRLLLWTMP